MLSEYSRCLLVYSLTLSAALPAKLNIIIYYIVYPFSCPNDYRESFELFRLFSQMSPLTPHDPQLTFNFIMAASLVLIGQSNKHEQRS